MKALERIAQYIEWRRQIDLPPCFLVVERVAGEGWKAEFRVGIKYEGEHVFREYAPTLVEAVESLATNVLLPERD